MRLYGEILRQAVYDLRAGNREARDWILKCSKERLGFGWICRRICDILPAPPRLLSKPEHAAKFLVERWWIASEKMTHRSGRFGLNQPKESGNLGQGDCAPAPHKE